MSAITDEYIQRRPLYEAYAATTAGLIERLVVEAGLPYHSIAWRAKDPASLEKKVDRSGGRYQALSDIMDLAGVRVITYFEEDVDAVASLLESEFEIEFEHSVDKRATLSPDQFGYLSVHYVASLSPSRSPLSEYRRFANCVVEIQVRSILQHTWAEIEHDLGYKVEGALPRQFRRRFSRLAGLLETADVEFGRLRRDLREYESQVAEQIEEAPQHVLIDGASIRAFTDLDASVVSLLEEYRNRNVEVVRSGFNEPLAELPAALEMLGIRTIGELQRLLADRIAEVRQMLTCDIEHVLREHPNSQIAAAAASPILHLVLLLSAEIGGEEYLVKVQQQSGINEGFDPSVFADRAWKCYKMINKS